MTNWNPLQYLKFLNERTEPSKDLLSKINIDPINVLDIGCGTGNSTNELKNKFQNSNILGIDTSSLMIEKAKKTYPNLNFKLCDALNIKSLNTKFDLIFSNACIHWIKSQETLFDEIYDSLNSNGLLAVQIPLTYKSDFYKVLYNMLDTNPKYNKLKDLKFFYQLTPDKYYELLSKKFKSVKMWETTYYHVVSSFDSVIEWYKGSGLKPYLDLLSDSKKEVFLEELKEKIKENYKVYNDNSIILKMPRLFFIALK